MPEVLESTPAALAAPVLEMRGISKTFSGVNALENVDFVLYPGEVHALMGENGAGKSTLMKILSGLYQPTQGEIILKGLTTVIFWAVSGPRELVSRSFTKSLTSFRISRPQKTYSLTAVSSRPSGGSVGRALMRKRKL